MDGLRQYMLSIVCTCLIFGILMCVISGSAKAVVKILCGAFLAATIISPLTRLDLGRELALMLPDTQEARRLTNTGEEMARRSLAEIIKQKSEAYILNKATGLHENLTVEITVSDEAAPAPVSAVLTGKVSPFAKAKLETIFETDLGIPKEKLQWIG